MAFRLRYIKQGRVIYTDEIEARDEHAVRINAESEFIGEPHFADWCEVAEIKQPRPAIIRVAETVTTR